MNLVDYLIIVVLLASMVLGAVRGFVREAVGLLSWLGGVWLAWRYAPLLEPHLGGAIGEPPVSTWAARVLILLAVLLAGWLIAAILGYLLRHSGLSLLVDRLLGLLFGVLRGAVVVSIFVLLGRFVELDRVEWWQESQLLPYASELAGWIQAFAETGMDALEQRSAAVASSISAGV
jgi:membrane protein required for colicin V production